MLCILHKWFIARRMDSAEPLPQLVVRHIGRCPTCKSFHDNCLALAMRLPEGALRQTREVSVQLHTKIMRGLRTQPQANAAAARAEMNIPRHRPILAPAIATAVVLLAVVAVYFYSSWGSTRQKPHSSSPWAGISNDEPTVWLIGPEDLAAEPASLIEEVVQWPMEEEMRLLRQDGRAAADFLLACVPPVDVNMLTENNSP